MRQYGPLFSPKSVFFYLLAVDRKRESFFCKKKNLMGPPEVPRIGNINFLREFLYITMNDIFTQLQNEGLTLKIHPLVKKFCSNWPKGEEKYGIENALKCINCICKYFLNQIFLLIYNAPS